MNKICRIAEIEELEMSQQESCVPASISDTDGKVIPFRREKPTLPGDISERAWEAIGILRSEFKIANDDSDLEATRALARAVIRALKDHFNAVSHKVLTKALQRVLDILGRPSGSSPPPKPSVFILPPPKVWWRDYKKEYISKGKSPADFIIEHYGLFINKENPSQGLSRASLAQPGQDRQLYDAFVHWYQKHDLPKELDPYLLTPSELNERRLQEVGGRVTVKTVPDPHERMRLNSHIRHRDRRLAS
jgi:hypothetical protein